MNESAKSSIIINTIFYLLGICTLLPWNFFITADTFWQYKLRNTSYGENTTSPDGSLSALQIAFTPTFVFLSNGLTLVFCLVTSAFTMKYSDRCRIFSSFGLTIFSMVGVTIFGIINTDEWQEVFFGLIMILVSLLNVGIGIFQTSLYGLAGILGEEVITSFISGQAISGVVSSFAMIISLAMGQSNPITSGIVYFVIADIILFVSLASYYYLIKMAEYTSLQSQMSTINPVGVFTKENYRLIKKVLIKIKWFVFSSGMILIVTLATFPAVQVYITSSLSPSTWTKVYYQPTVTFLVFNVFDLVGRELSRRYKWPKNNGRMMLPVVTVLRIIFIPLILLCNGENKTFPTVFYNDAFYFIFNILSAFTNGYFMSIAFLYYASSVENSEIELAGTIIACGSGIGMTIGSAISPGLVALWGPRKQ